MIRIGMLTSGGDCQALNAAMRGVAKTLYNSGEDVELYGFLNGYQGLIHGRFRLLTYDDFSGILTKGGTFLGSSRTPFKTIQVIEEDGIDKVAAMKQTYYKLQLDVLVSLGGNGTQHDLRLPERRGHRHRLHRHDPHHRRLPRPHLHRGDHGPQGGLAAAERGHGRRRGHHTDPRDPLRHRQDRREDQGTPRPRRLLHHPGRSPYPSVSYEIAAKLTKKTGYDVRVTVPGHTQRGGAPCPYDRVFASRLGSEAGKLILKKEFGFMVGYKNREIVKVPLKDVAGKLKMVDPDASIIKEAKMLGISFGD